MKLKIQVTKEDIEEGNPCSGFDCPVSIALKRAAEERTNSRLEVWVSEAVINLWSPDNETNFEWVCSDLPPEMVEFINSYDNGKEVKEIEVEIEFELVDITQGGQDAYYEV